MKTNTPHTVPAHYKKIFAQRMQLLTPYKEKSLIFAADHKIEQGAELSPEHFFTIAQKSKLILATQLGLIARYASSNSKNKFVVKVTAKTPTQKLRNQDPYSVPISQMEEIKKYMDENPDQIVGIGLTIYLGSAQEEIMLAKTSQIINQAHQLGLPTILWSYVRGAAIPPLEAHNFLPLAASIATSLGADFAKLQLPPAPLSEYTTLLNNTKNAAGNTQLLFAGGAPADLQDLFEKTDFIVHHLGWNGGAIGRNIFEHPTNYACLIAETMTKLIAGEIDAEEALAKVTEPRR